MNPLFLVSLFWMTQAIAVQGAIAEAMTVKRRPTLVLIIGGKR